MKNYCVNKLVVQENLTTTLCGGLLHVAFPLHCQRYTIQLSWHLGDPRQWRWSLPRRHIDNYGTLLTEECQNFIKTYLWSLNYQMEDLDHYHNSNEICFIYLFNVLHMLRYLRMPYYTFHLMWIL